MLSYDPRARLSPPFSPLLSKATALLSKIHAMIQATVPEAQSIGLIFETTEIEENAVRIVIWADGV